LTKHDDLTPLLRWAPRLVLALGPAPARAGHESDIHSIITTAVIFFTTYSPLSTWPFQRCYRCYHYVMQSRSFAEFCWSPVLNAIGSDERL